MLRHLPYKIHKIYLINRQNSCKVYCDSSDKLVTLIHSSTLKKKNLSKEMVIVMKNWFQNCEVLPLCFLSGKPQHCSSFSINKSNMMNCKIHLERSLKTKMNKKFYCLNNKIILPAWRKHKTVGGCYFLPRHEKHHG